MATPSNDWPAIAAWRKATRATLIGGREAVPLAQRRAQDGTINALLEQAFSGVPLAVLAFCWPYRGEVDVRFAVRTLRARGTIAALPEVAGKAMPLRFRRWEPGVPMQAGALGIPAPVGTELVGPDAALVPLVGFDPAGYRLGYGGGYFDRTLARLPTKPVAIGVGTEALRLPTIHPQPHDIAMDFIVTEAGIRAVEAGSLVAQSSSEAAARMQTLVASRRC